MKGRGEINLGMLLVGLNKCRDLHSDLMTHTEVGTGTAKETKEDTDLETPVTSETARDSATKTNQQVVIQATIVSGIADDIQVSEIIWKKDSPELAHSRVTVEPVQKTTGDDWVITTRWFYKDRFE